MAVRKSYGESDHSGGKELITNYAVRCPDIECQGCAVSIKRSLGKVTGVDGVEVDVAKKRVTVVFDDEQTSASALGERLTAAGFPSEAESAE